MSGCRIWRRRPLLPDATDKGYRDVAPETSTSGKGSALNGLDQKERAPTKAPFKKQGDTRNYMPRSERSSERATSNSALKSGRLSRTAAITLPEILPISMSDG